MEKEYQELREKLIERIESYTLSLPSVQYDKISMCDLCKLLAAMATIQSDIMLLNKAYVFMRLFGNTVEKEENK